MSRAKKPQRFIKILQGGRLVISKALPVPILILLMRVTEDGCGGYSVHDNLQSLDKWGGGGGILMVCTGHSYERSLMHAAAMYGNRCR
jgi:hypothetical protein